MAADRTAGDAVAEGSRFWETRALDALTDQQWEALCDGCGRCCLQKLEDEDDGTLYWTDIACRLLDVNRCRCSDYARRFEVVPDCLSVRPLTDQIIAWLPRSCAYRRLAEGRALADWHPLISGDPDSVRRAGISVAGRCISETDVPLSEWPQHLVDGFGS